ncbi:MAG: hypothetical protein R3B96_16760 [Pirellulaceae bacterium]
MDQAALHHVVDDGWLWQLAFDNSITSVGWCRRSIGLDVARVAMRGGVMAATVALAGASGLIGPANRAAG